MSASRSDLGSTRSSGGRTRTTSVRSRCSQSWACDSRGPSRYVVERFASTTLPRRGSKSELALISVASRVLVLLDNCFALCEAPTDGCFRGPTRRESASADRVLA
jgi:hypothetical protein